MSFKKNENKCDLKLKITVQKTNNTIIRILYTVDTISFM